MNVIRIEHNKPKWQSCSTTQHILSAETFLMADCDVIVVRRSVVQVGVSHLQQPAFARRDCPCSLQLLNHCQSRPFLHASERLCNKIHRWRAASESIGKGQRTITDNL
jgi:hypothetical protein